MEKHPLQKGLAELMAYFSIASSQPGSYIHEDDPIDLILPGNPDRVIHLPNILFTR